jgi:hypothetical protein
MFDLLKVMQIYTFFHHHLEHANIVLHFVSILLLAQRVCRSKNNRIARERIRLRALGASQKKRRFSR